MVRRDGKPRASPSLCVKPRSLPSQKLPQCPSRKRRVQRTKCVPATSPDSRTKETPLGLFQNNEQKNKSHDCSSIPSYSCHFVDKPDFGQTHVVSSASQSLTSKIRKESMDSTPTPLHWTFVEGTSKGLWSLIGSHPLPAQSLKVCKWVTLTLCN